MNCKFCTNLCEKEPLTDNVFTCSHHQPYCVTFHMSDDSSHVFELEIVNDKYMTASFYGKNSEGSFSIYRRLGDSTRYRWLCSFPYHVNITPDNFEAKIKTLLLFK